MARFSKGDYVAVAQVIDATWSDMYARANGAGSLSSVDATVVELVTRFADMFEQDNARFDRARFVAACEGDAQDLFGLSA